VQAAFEQLNGPASSWSIGHIDVLLDAAYTGIDGSQLGSVLYSIYPAEVTSDAGPSAPPLLALPLTAPAGAPTHDLPVLSSPQPSDAPASPSADTIVDLTNVLGQPLGRDSETFNEVRTDLYPIAVPAALVNQVPVSAGVPTVTPRQVTVTGGTAEATVTQPPIVASTPLPLSAEVSLGAPEIDSNGRLMGMVISDAHGNHVLTGLDAVNQAIGPVSSKPGQLMSEWHLGLASYYASPPEYSQASSTFQTLAGAYPDFGGVSPFLTAAKQGSTSIPALTRGLRSPQVSPPSGATSTMTLEVLGGLGALVIVLGLVALLYLWRRRAERAKGRNALAFEDEAYLDLLPPDVPLEDLEKYQQPLESEMTMPLPALSASGIQLDQQATSKLPALPPQPTRVRQGTALMPHPSGDTHPGIKRANEPNQDNLFAVQGIRIVNGRPQPFGFFIVADGMGGHLNGQEASRVAIELMANTVLQAVNSTQAFDSSMLISLLTESVEHASATLRERNISEHLDMGTTITAALVVDDMAYIVNVGDSRTYLMSPDAGLRQITTDHSVVASLVSAGVIRPEEIYTHPRRNQIYRSLGGDQETPEVDTFEVPLQAGDKLLLCSDGLWEMVRDPQIEYILRGTADPKQAVDLLVREANTNGGEDNISAIVVRMLEDVPEHARQELRVIVAPREGNPAPSQY
jgi:serine/threonine protein phosphatase PrpC